MRKYEYIYILDPHEETTQKSIQELKSRYQDIGARLLKEEDMGKRKLAYEINKKTDGFYYITQIEIDDFRNLDDFERDLKLNPDIIRFMRVRI